MRREDAPHRRRNALTGEWVQVSPHRTQRPWQGKVDETNRQSRPEYDPSCYLCPGNDRAGGKQNPSYSDTFVFDNDFAALLPEVNRHDSTDHELFTSMPVRGTCRVICFSPRHDLTLAQMPEVGIHTVIDTWAAQVDELGPSHRWVQVFENKGEQMGCSNPHPHGQVWALDALPNEAAKELRTQQEYVRTHGNALLRDYAEQEAQRQERVVEQSDGWLAVVPYWATWPFEVLLLPRDPVPHLPQLSVDQRQDLACILRRLLQRYDGLFDTSFPYSMGWHGQPCDGDGEGWQLHAHFYPPLLRSAEVRKFMVGYEMLAEAQRDLTAEAAAERMRSVTVDGES